VTGARIIDGTGRPPIAQGTILISDGRITAVGAADAVTVPAGATRVEAAGKTIMPGLVIAHGHLQVWGKITMPTRDDLIRRLRTYSSYGATTVLSLGSTPTDELEGIKLRDEQERPGLDRARLYTSGVVAIGKTPDEARRAVKRLADLGVDVIKFQLMGNPNDMPGDVYGALIDEAHRRNLRVAVHIWNLSDAKGAIARGADIIAHSVRDMDVDAAFLADMKRLDVEYIPTLTRDLSAFVYESTPAFFKEPFFQRGIALYRDEVQMVSDPGFQAKVRANPVAQAVKPAIEQAYRNLKLVSDAGVTVAAGSDTGSANNPGRWQGYFEHVEMELMVKAGMTPMQVLVAATGGASRVAPQLNRVGTLEPGKWADLLVLNANPLDDIRNTRQIDQVWIGGRRLAEAGQKPTQ
jgi:imidazolonepropionase-like amidohydrolase